MDEQLEARYRALFETTLDAILVVNDEGIYVDVNESLCRLLKASREELLGAHFSQFIPPPQLESATTLFADLKAVGSFEGEFSMRAADGSVVELEWRSRANFVPGLHLYVARDITARKRAEEAVSHRERLFRTLVNASSQSVWHHRPDGPPNEQIDRGNAAWWREFTKIIA